MICACFLWNSYYTVANNFLCMKTRGARRKSRAVFIINTLSGGITFEKQIEKAPARPADGGGGGGSGGGGGGN